MNIETLITQGSEMLESDGTPPQKVARELLDTYWNEMTRADQIALAVDGLGARIGVEQYMRRIRPVAPTPRPMSIPEPPKTRREEERQRKEAARREREKRDQERADIKAIHDQVECSSTHGGDISPSRCMWLRGALSIPPGPAREAEIERARKTNQQWNAEDSARVAKRVATLELYVDIKSQEYAKKVLKSLRLEASDGTMRTFFDFTLADAEKWLAKSDTLAESWAERRSWFEDVCQALRTYTVETIGDLPDEIGEALAGRAEAIWKKA